MRRVLPVYLVIDVSGSMSSGLKSIERAILDFADELAVSPLLGETVRVAILAFARETELVLPLSDLAYSRSIPHLPRSRGPSNLGEAVRSLVLRIQSDLRNLANADPFRPLIVLVTDAEYPGEKQSLRADLDRVRANLILLTPEGVDRQFVDELRPIQSLVWRPWDGPGPLLAGAVVEAARSLVRSTVIGSNGPHWPEEPA